MIPADQSKLPDWRPGLFSTPAFTLVELIVVITILAILGTVGFLSLQGYSSSARDSARISDLANLSKAMDAQLAAEKLLPQPNAPMVTLTASGTTVGYQGCAGSGVTSALGLSGLKDPLNGTCYTYETNAAQNKYQVLSLQESASQATASLPLVQDAYAGTYDARIPSTRGNQLGILLGTGANLNQPLQEYASFTGLDLVNTTNSYAEYFSNTDAISGTGASLFSSAYSHRPDLLIDKSLAKNDASLVGYWAFDEWTWSTSSDLSYSWATANLTGSTIWKQGKSGQALDFQSAGYAYVTSKPKLNFWTGSFSVSMWGYYRDFTYPKAWFMIGKSNICYQPGGPGWSIGHGYQSTGISICYSDGVNWATENTVSFDPGSRPDDPKGRWANLVTVFDLAQKKVIFYVNGKRQTNTLSLAWVPGSVNNTEDLMIWSMHGWQTDGLLDEVRIYNRALSDTEAQNLYISFK